MAGLFSKVTKFARSPQGQKLIQQAQAAAKDPKNRAKVEQLGNQLKTRADSLRGKGKPEPGEAAAPVPGPEPVPAPDPIPAPEPVVRRAEERKPDQAG